jgi:hypothetical protein
MDDHFVLFTKKPAYSAYRKMLPQLPALMKCEFAFLPL